MTSMRTLKTSNLIWLGVAAIVFFFGVPHGAFAATNINSAANEHWAWNDLVGWIDFYSNGDVTLLSQNLTGSALSSVSYVSLDCNTSPGGNICGASNYQVKNSGGSTGNLSGWAWNDEVGWITFFWGDSTADPIATSTYSSVCNTYGLYCGVQVLSNGDFRGYAWNDMIGWISFNCVDLGVCGTSGYKTATSWRAVAATGYLDSATLDTGVASGTQLNSVTWQGSLNGIGSGAVSFQFAGSNSSSGPWSFKGPDGTASTTYIGPPATPIPITNYSAYNIYRYFRYRVILASDLTQTVSPMVDSVSLDWSP